MKSRSQLRYIFPNFFTSATLFSGFIAIIFATENEFILAALAVFIGMLMDGLDGFAARIAKAQSSFGSHFDSLADMLTFGAAPALIIYFWSLHYLGYLGVVIAFIYALAVCFRLARYNNQLGKQDKAYFSGLPSPSGAGLVASSVWMGAIFAVNTKTITHYVAGYILILSLLLASNIPFRSHRGLSRFTKISALLVVITALLSLTILPLPVVLFLVYASYVISNFIQFTFKVAVNIIGQ